MSMYLPVHACMHACKWLHAYGYVGVCVCVRVSLNKEGHLADITLSGSPAKHGFTTLSLSLYLSSISHSTSHAHFPSLSFSLFLRVPALPPSSPCYVAIAARGP